MTLLTADFETWPIFSRPYYPPKPVGLALKLQGGAPTYCHWGHMTGEANGSARDARATLLSFWEDPTVEIAFHNAKFDLAVAIERWDLPMLPWHRIHDTLLLAFLNNPYEAKLGLKPLATKYLGLPPAERDDVAGWVQENKKRLEVIWHSEYAPTLGRMTVQKGKEGAWIFAAPGEIVDPYACGDVVRTEGLVELLLPAIDRMGMREAYDRERQLLPILLRNECEGMRVDMEGLERDLSIYGEAFKFTEDLLRQALHASGLNFDADQDVAAILIERGIVPEANWSRTPPTKAHPNGQLSTSKDNLLPELFTGSYNGVPGSEIASALGYRNRLATCLGHFMGPWHAQASVNKGYITTNWQQVRGFNDGGGGARTGRATTADHNFLNISKDFESARDDQYVHPTFLGVPNLPLCRTYVLPDEGEMFMHRDFSGQELRVFAHFEQGELHERYQADPAMDPHKFVGAELMRVAGREIDRTRVKTMNFQGLYGGGAPALSKKLRVSLGEAKQLKQFHDAALPGRKLLNEEITRILRRGDPIRTWGGRLYWGTPPENGRETLYKVMNYEIQGSAADLTKQAIIDWDAALSSLPPWVKPARFMVTVYDEINTSTAPEGLHENMKLLKDVMEAPRLTVPMLSDGKVGPAWGKLEKYADA